MIKTDDLKVGDIIRAEANYSYTVVVEKLGRAHALVMTLFGSFNDDVAGRISRFIDRPVDIWAGALDGWYGYKTSQRELIKDRGTKDRDEIRQNWARIHDRFPAIGNWEPS